MRPLFFTAFLAVAAVLILCANKSFRSVRSIGKAVAFFLCALIPPVLGNALIVISGNETVSLVGYYMYFLGMNCVMTALIHFTNEYCFLTKKERIYKYPAVALLAIDTAQMICNLRWGHAFAMEAVEAGGYVYYSLTPLAGQAFHRFVDYGILAVTIFFFFMRTVNAPKINRERYSVILLSMIATTIWESFYIFSRTPIDRSMFGFGFFGILVYYFSLIFRPMRLLDSMLSHIASALPEALYFFDGEEKCIWANQAGIELVNIEDEDFEVAYVRLKKLFGENITSESKQHEIFNNDQLRTYVVEKHTVGDETGRLAGSFISVRDNTAEQVTLREEVYKATHDPLTKVYNRAGYNVLISQMQLWKTIMLLIDGDSFKSINDTYGHDVGDKILQKIASTIKRNFRAEDHVCRIGGDEFVVLMLHSDSAQKELIIDRIKRINGELTSGQDGLPPISISVGVAYGQFASDSEDLFEHADKALYETKGKGKKGFTFYEDLTPEKQ